ncbi:adenosylmethionine--8-amino-7-oxononanoate transaminase [Corynebacterium resistens]|uniref:adenosylmethionine--8-amino-7-oxononanoate transaminase n=1 Tax=Corynebacterium resistens TaxID=258224 RepID=UPI0023548B9A|nr:adenosylmethionine--8-amino-7-oxononanoate transaminase [Corynebacterium resistens]
MKSLNSVQVNRIDAAHIWHPYAAPGVPTLQVVGTEGAYLQLADGRQVIDGMSSWWAACHGHSHPRLVAAAKQQIDSFSHVMFGGLTHEPAARLTANLMELTANEFAQVFYSDSGSVSVEVAVKMALQYSRGIGKPERTKLLTWRSGYHGDTFAAMSVCDPHGGMHSLWTGILAEQIFAPAPPVEGASPEEHAAYLAQMEQLITDEVAGIIIEPGVQGAGGMRFHDLQLVAGVRELCDKHEIVMIADEIATGFGRAGELFMTQAAGVVPDIMCVGKALTGGFMSLAATLATERITKGMQPRALMHGPTFMANPLACAVAAESTAIIAEGTWRSDVSRIEAGLRAGIPGARVRGAIGVLEMDHEVDMVQATAAALEHGVWLRPFGRLIYTMPPYVCTDEEIARICWAVIAAGETA